MKNFLKFCKDSKKNNIKYIYIKGDKLFCANCMNIGMIKLDFDISKEHQNNLYWLDYERFILLEPKSKEDFEYKEGKVFIKGNFMENKDVNEVTLFENQEGTVVRIKDWKKLDFISQIVNEKNFSPILTYVCLRDGTAYGTDSYEIREAKEIYEGGEWKDFFIEKKAFRYGEIEAIRFWKYGTVRYKDSGFMYRYDAEVPWKYPDIDYDRIVGTEIRKHITRGNELPEYKGKFDWLAFKFDNTEKRLKVYWMKDKDKIQLWETAMFWEELENDIAYEINYKYWNEKKLKGDFTYEIIETEHWVFMWKRQQGVKTLIRLIKDYKFSI